MEKNKVFFKRLIIVVIVLVLGSCGLYCYLHMGNMKMEPSKIVIAKGDISLNKESVQKGVKFHTENLEFCHRINEFLYNSDVEYGKIFEVTYCIDCRRYFEKDEFIASVKLNLEDLDDNIFFLESDSGDRLFDNSDYDEKMSNKEYLYDVNLTGCTRNYTDAQLNEIIKKVKFEVTVQNAHGDTKKYNFSGKDFEKQEIIDHWSFDKSWADGNFK